MLASAITQERVTEEILIRREIKGRLPSHGVNIYGQNLKQSTKSIIIKG